MMGTGTPNAVDGVDDLRHGCRGGLGVDRDAHQFRAGRASAITWFTVEATSAVSVLVIDCTTIG
jgi:hypothetical protein